MRRKLDALYDAAGVLAALFLVGTLGMMALGIAGRLIWYFPQIITYLPEQMKMG
ncbi:MAG: hypothetical protein ABWZ29_00560 [Casimicrobiaceae bacterium]|jgi:hypothetical protein